MNGEEMMMRHDIPRLCVREEFAKAGPGELVALPPRPGTPPMTVSKTTLEGLAHGIVSGAFIHVHGETGTGKSALLESLGGDADAWAALCSGMRLPFKPLRMFPIEMVLFETPAELYTRRAIRDGRTYDEESCLVHALREAAASAEQSYNLIWLREMGRVHSASVQGGLLNLITDGTIQLPNGNDIDAKSIAWVADSNYNADETAVHTVVELDNAIARRAVVNIPCDYLPPEDEVRIVCCFESMGYLPTTDEALVTKVVDLGQAIRVQRRQGNLASVAPPTLHGYFAFLRMAHALAHLPIQDVANMTLLGSASPSDREQLAGLFSEVFGVRKKSQKDALMGGESL
jgi:hypothetical protein